MITREKRPACVLFATAAVSLLGACAQPPAADPPGASVTGGEARPALVPPQGEPPANRIAPPHGERVVPVEDAAGAAPGAWTAASGCRLVLRAGGGASAEGCAAPLGAIAQWRVSADARLRIEFLDAADGAVADGLMLRADRIELIGPDGERRALTRTE
ncbi:MAG: hypothetical protein ACOC05_02105 [Oceanicaulis sp.]